MEFDIRPDGVPESGPPNSTWSTCPVRGCTWAIRSDPPDVSPSALAGVFGPGVLSATSLYQFRAELERHLEAHLESHSVLDWAQTVGDLQKRLAEASAELEQYRSRFGPFAAAVDLVAEFLGDNLPSKR